MSSFDSLLYAQVRTRLTEAPSTVISSTPVLVGRDDYPDSNLPKEPGIHYSPVSTAGQNIIDATFDLNIVEKRSKAFGSGGTLEAAGRIDNIESAMVNRMLGWTPTITGWSTGPVSLRFQYRTTFENPETITWRRKFGFMAIRGGTQVPLSGTEGTLSVSGLDGIIEFWQVNVRAPLKTAKTEIRDRTPRFHLGDPIATGFMRLALTKDGTNNTLPRIGSSLVATFSTTSGVSWNDTILIHNYEWLTGPNEPKQVVNVQFAVSNANSPFYAEPA